jgi:glutamate-1-semialdehyde 2,1-aminomutase
LGPSRKIFSQRAVSPRKPLKIRVFQRLDSLGEKLEAGFRDAASSAGIPVATNRVGSMMTGFFQESPVADFDSASISDTECYGRYQQAMLRQGIYLAPSQFEATFVSLAHTDADIEAAGQAAKETLASLKV